MDIFIFLVALVIGFLAVTRLLPRFYSLGEGEEAPLSSEEIKKGSNEESFFLVYFYSPGCGACKKMSPTIEDIGQEYRVVKVDTSKDQKTARDFKVLGVPTLFGIKEGKVSFRFTGMKSRKEILSKISSL